MTTAVDTNVLSSLWNNDDTLNRIAVKALEEAQSKGRLVVCGPVYAELLAAPARSSEFVDAFFAEARIEVEWELGERIWREAGTAYQIHAQRRKKQRAGEPRRILADFLIGAHAHVNGDRLLTMDGQVYVHSFPRLVIVEI